MKYDGGKNGSGVYQRLICMMPPHELYVEAFAGSAAILRRKRPADKSIAYELNARTIFELAGHMPADRFVPWNINADWKSPADPLPGNGGTSIGFNHADNPDRSAVEIIQADAFEQLQSKFVAGAFTYGLHDPADVLIYVDPPYPKSVRSSPGKLYEFELMAEQEHAELCDLLLSVPARVMLSGYENELYNRKLKGWRKETIPTTNRAGKKVIETVWLNFPPTIELHDATHVGQNFRERWSITKRVRNWTGQLKAMPPGTRQAITEALNAEMAEYLNAGRTIDAVAMNKLERRAAIANKKRKPATPRTALFAGKPADVPLFE
jgi:DNA adenine methylase